MQRILSKASSHSSLLMIQGSTTFSTCSFFLDFSLLFSRTAFVATSFIISPTLNQLFSFRFPAAYRPSTLRKWPLSSKRLMIIFVSGLLDAPFFGIQELLYGVQSDSSLGSCLSNGF
ncbi:hypothetical protein CEXT_34691 [Caerostris extrusa]|uniref:Uncharacterized protein n=1 Tax=Caerostris extrusa TaxID=172846 RepID=A0AAV4VUV3_CAEEX|nr:hypothetical protein CEXT_34691 [Caerostris extrusa]